MQLTPDSDINLTVDLLLPYKEKLRKEQYVALMMFASGSKQESIALELRIPIGTVKSRVFRGKRNLKRLINAVA